MAAVDQTVTGEATAAALADVRVLDLTGEMGALATRLLAGMGADVLRIEPPAGHATRRRGPFLDHIPSPERSLYWMQMNGGKRSVTLNLESADGRALFRRLAATADLIVESLPVGELGRLGLGYDALVELNPRLIVTSISAYGQDGPRAHDEGTDLIGMATGGLMYLCGDRDRPPVRVTVEQAYAQVGIQAAAATLIVLAARHQTGSGAHLDISMQESMLGTLANNRLHWPAARVVTHRAGGGRAFGDAGSRLIFATEDGYVGFMRRAEQSEMLAQWLVELGIEVPFDVAGWKSLPSYGPGSPPADQVAVVEDRLARAFAGERKHDLQDAAQRRGMILAEVATPADLATSAHLAQRGYFRRVEYPELGGTLTVPGAPFIAAQTPWRTARAPRIGEHNRAVYQDELGLTTAELVALKACGAV